MGSSAGNTWISPKRSAKHSFIMVMKMTDSLLEMSDCPSPSPMNTSPTSTDSTSVSNRRATVRCGSRMRS